MLSSENELQAVKLPKDPVQRTVGELAARFISEQFNRNEEFHIPSLDLVIRDGETRIESMETTNSWSKDR